MSQHYSQTGPHAPVVFDMADGWLSTDTEGTEFADMSAARSQALEMAAEVLRSQSEDFEQSHEWALEVHDERGASFSV